ncbi:MAG: AMP-binding protein, partial [Treponema sp.]|nr:AMP-binding protein [Treponema sp.]
ATLFAGGIICPIDYALKIEEQENLLSVAEPKFLFCDEEKYVQYEKKDTPYKLYSINPKFPEKYVYNLKPAGEPEIQRPTEDETAAILFTSGTTGNPKGVMLSHRNFVSDAFAAQTQMIVTETDIFYALLPLHHAYTMLAVFIEAFCLGGELVFGKSMVVSRIMKELKEGQITMLMGVPMLFNKFMQGIMKGIRAKGIFVYGFIRFLMGVSYCIKKVFRVNPGKKMFKSILKQANLYTVRIAICGGGPLAKSVFKLYNEMGINFVQGYGLTETSPILTLNPLEHFKIESVGRYFSRFMEMKIMDPDSEGVGEIVVKGPMVMQGYYKMPEETAKMFTEDGWFKTGDLGWLDKENYLMLAGRVKNMIVTEGGKNVYPEEIEDMFQLQTDIQQITVQGYIANEAKTQEELEALVYPSDELFARLGCTRETADKAVVEAEIKKDVEAVNRNLLPYQRMTRITILEKPLEMTTTLKVKRNYKK